MANLSDFGQLAGSFSTSITKKRVVDPGNKELYWNGRDYSVPSETIQAAYKVFCNAEQMEKTEKSNPEKYEQFLELKNMIRAFGLDCRPTFIVDKGALKGMYNPGIHKTTDAIKKEIGNYDLCMRLGNIYLPLVFNKETEKWESVPAKGCEKIVLRWDDAKQSTQGGEIKLLVANCGVNGSEKLTDLFVARAASKRQEKDPKKDAYSASDLRKAFEKGDTLALQEMLTTPSNGNGWQYQFSEDKFVFGKYPVVSLKRERRKVENKSWLNYIVKVIDQNGEECNIRLENNQQAIWTALSNCYTWVDEDNNTHEVTTEDDFFGDSSVTLKYCLIYYSKQKIERKNQQSGQMEVKYYGHIKHELYDSDVFSPLTPEEQKSLNGNGNVVNQPNITGVDDFMGADMVNGTKQTVPM